MILYAPNSTYAVHFTHQRTAMATTRWDRITYCTVHEGPCQNSTRPCLTNGSTTSGAWCSKLDNFNRATGRKIAFGRAIRPLPKDVRTALWRGYLKRTNVIGEVH